MEQLLTPYLRFCWTLLELFGPYSPNQDEGSDKKNIGYPVGEIGPIMNHGKPKLGSLPIPPSN